MSEGGILLALKKRTGSEKNSKGRVVSGLYGSTATLSLSEIFTEFIEVEVCERER